MKRPLDYIEAALSRMDLSGDAALARMMKVHRGSIYQWRHELSFPSKEKLKLLADLAGMDETEALFWRAYWLADEEARAALIQAKRWLGALFVCVFLGLCSPAQAGTLPAHSTSVNPEIYIITH